MRHSMLQHGTTRCNARCNTLQVDNVKGGSHEKAKGFSPLPSAFSRMINLQIDRADDIPIGPLPAWEDARDLLSESSIERLQLVHA
jgi:hypothetical protein